VVPRVPAAGRHDLAVVLRDRVAVRLVPAVVLHVRVAVHLVPAVAHRVPAVPGRAVHVQAVVGARADVAPAALSGMLLARPRTRKRKPRNRPSSSRER